MCVVAIMTAIYEGISYSAPFLRGRQYPLEQNEKAPEDARQGDVMKLLLLP
jgi:hypothetical protein